MDVASVAELQQAGSRRTRAGVARRCNADAGLGSDQRRCGRGRGTDTASRPCWQPPGAWRSCDRRSSPRRSLTPNRYAQRQPLGTHAQRSQASCCRRSSGTSAVARLGAFVVHLLEPLAQLSLKILAIMEPALPPRKLRPIWR